MGKVERGSTLENFIDFSKIRTTAKSAKNFCKNDLKFERGFSLKISICDIPPLKLKKWPKMKPKIRFKNRV